MEMEMEREILLVKLIALGTLRRSNLLSYRGCPKHFKLLFCIDQLGAFCLGSSLPQTMAGCPSNNGGT